MRRKRQNGFTLMEMLVSLVIFMIVSSIVMSGMIQMMKTQGTVSNRTEIHTSVRSATELLQQEIGQAGRIALPKTVGQVNLTQDVAKNPVGNTIPQNVSISSTVNMFPNMLLDVDTGQQFEVVTLTAVAPGSISAVFTKDHTSNVTSHTYPVQVSGAFGTGIVPPAAGQPCATAGYFGYPNGSDCNHLKLYGDINGDGNIVYVEYFCDQAGGYLYRNQVSNAIVVGTPKPAVNASMYLLNNLTTNPDNSGCFNYQVQTAGVTDAAGNPVPFVTDVAVTLSVQTQQKDPSTQDYIKETKALLNITPRNVYYVWETTSLGEVPRNQPMPANVTSLLQ